LEKSSEVKGFYKLSASERLEFVRNFASLTLEEATILSHYGGLGAENANRMIENVVGTIQLPIGIATNFKINGRDFLIPFAVEESSVVAAASNAAKIARVAGGFTTTSSDPVMIGQIQLVNPRFQENDWVNAIDKIKEREKELIAFANSRDKTLAEFGGGAREIQARVVKAFRGQMLAVHLLVDVRDAMGANAVNTMCEALAPKLEELTGATARLRIISNLAVHRTASAKAVFPKSELAVEGICGGEETIERILDAYAFAVADEYRACTHNKGVMNGVDAVVIATGNDWRAIEAGAHAFATLSGKYSPLTKYYKNEKGDLVGEITLPVPVGLVGGATKTNPVARVCVKILGVKTARELGEVLAAVGLAQNFAALRALATEGIQKGHMKLHAKNIAVVAGAKNELVDVIAQRMVEEKNVSVDRARELLKELTNSKN